MNVAWEDIIKEAFEGIINDNLFIGPYTNLGVYVHYTCDGDPEKDDPMITIYDKNREMWIGSNKNSLVGVLVAKTWGFISVNYMSRTDLSCDRRFHENEIELQMNDPKCLENIMDIAKKAIASLDTVNFGDVKFDDTGDYS